jgi:hypothetical protein
MSQIYLIFQLAYLYIFELYVSYCHIVSQCDTHHGCRTCDMSHFSQIALSLMSLVIKYVIRGLLVTDFNEVLVGEGKGGGKRWFQGLWQTTLLSAEGKNFTSTYIVCSVFVSSISRKGKAVCRRPRNRFLPHPTPSTFDVKWHMTMIFVTNVTLITSVKQITCVTLHCDTMWHSR